jgi:acetoin utilization deacetylase AcuC-like enzyme
MHIIYDDFFLKHSAGDFHPENAARVMAIMEKLKSVEGHQKSFNYVKPFPAGMDLLTIVHDEGYILKVKELSGSGASYYLDPDTMVSEHTYECACLAAGAAVTGVEILLENRLGANGRDCMADSFFAPVRPPGHHAFSGKGSGFCIFNNIAIAAMHALNKYKLERIAIIDFDVHHGNGTQEIFYEEPRVFYVSLHQYPHYPGSGCYTETGKGRGKGYNMNISLTPFSTEADYITAFLEIILPVLARYAPQLILVSAGYDGHIDDNLSDMELESSSYYKISRIIKIINHLSKIKNKSGQNGTGIGFILEGGYSLSALAESVAETLRAAEYEDTFNTGEFLNKDISGLINCMKDFFLSGGPGILSANRQNRIIFENLKGIFLQGEKDWAL